MSGSHRNEQPAERSARDFPPSAFRTWALALVAAHLLLGLLLYEPALFPGGDNADYMILGEAIRSGSGYRDLHLPGQPLHTKYPPGYPLLLAVLGVAGGVQLFKLASLALGAGSVWLLASLGRRLVGARTALLAAGLLAASPVLLEYSHYVLSEAAFTFLLLLALGLAARAEEEGGAAGDEDREPADASGERGVPGEVQPDEASRKRAFALAVLAGVAAFFTRTAGLALLVALPLAALAARRPRRALAAAAAGAAALLAWGVFQRLAAPGRPGYLQELLLVNPYYPGAGRIDLAGLATRAATNAWTYVSRVLPESLAGGGGGEAGAVALLLGLAVALCALAGWAARAGERVGTAEVVLLLYGGLIVAWPSVWTDRRFLLPILPLLLLYALYGATRLARRGLPARRAWLGALVLAALPAALALRSAVGLIPARMECLASYRAGVPCDPPALASLYQAARWAAVSTEPDAVIANRKPSLFYWYSHRVGDLYRYSTEPELVVRGLEEMGADYVVVDQVSATTFRYLVPAIERFPERFELVYRGGEPPTLVLRFLPRAITALGPPAPPAVSP